MKFPLSWLREFIDCNETPFQIAHLLTSLGIEVDEVVSSPMKFNGVVVADVQKVEPHPDADKLKIATVFDGVNSFQVVCGAPNCRGGIKTAFAKVGATFVEDNDKTFTIKKSMLRGVESNGMLCSSKELNIGSDADGIIEFDDYISLGADVANLYADTFFSVTLTPNLGHCASILGIARELSAVIDKPVLYHPLNSSDSLPKSQVTLDVQETSDCPRYACMVIRNVKVAASPLWLKQRIEACGWRSVNNIVDITNFVLMELGQPLHAFDLEKIEKETILVRKAKDGENLTTLDGKKRALYPEDLLICDAIKPLALAGVMGGADSEVTENTKNILLESAFFHPEKIRAMSRRHNLGSEASRRFEKGCDPNGVIAALERAALLIQELCGGQIEATEEFAGKKFERHTIHCSIDKINALLGLNLSQNEIETIFTRLSFLCQAKDDKNLVVSVPTYRSDLREEVDLIEEVARIYGYDQFDQPAAAAEGSIMPNTAFFSFEKKVRDNLVKQGLQEFVTCDLISPAQAEIDRDFANAAIWVKNPSSVEQSVLRTNLLPGLLQVISYNSDRQIFDIAGFILGKIYFKQDDHFVEKNVLALGLTGKKYPSDWDSRELLWDFYDLKGIVENFFLSCSLPLPKLIFSENQPNLHPGRQALLSLNDRKVGAIAEVHPTLLRKQGVTQKVYFAEIDLDLLSQQPLEPIKMKPLPQYPSIERVWTVTISEQMPLEQLLLEINKASSKLLEGEALFENIFRSEKVGKDKKNVSLKFVYRSPEKTLEQESVDKEHQRIIASVAAALHL